MSYIGLLMRYVGLPMSRVALPTLLLTAAAALLAMTRQCAAGAPDVSSADDDQWVRNGRDVGGSYYSPLADINPSSLHRIGFVWDYHLGTRRGSRGDAAGDRRHHVCGR